MNRRVTTSWKTERTGTSHGATISSDPNRFPQADGGQFLSERRKRIWVGGYSRQNGTHVPGYYRSTPNHRVMGG
jgi:hypothetical protein